jgi:hypothetical protein
MLFDFKTILEKYRNDYLLRENLKWIVSEENKKDYLDINRFNRVELSLALQFERESGDEELIKFLFEQEILDRYNDPFQGGSEVLRRTAFFLTEFKKPDNVWLFLAAKTANFDTHCGFDYEYILSAGIDKTFDYIQKNEHPLKEYFFDYFETKENCPLTQSDIDDWYENLKLHFPKIVEESNPEFLMDLAIELNQIEKVSDLLQIWKKDKIWDINSLKSYKYYLSFLEKVEEEIEVKLKILDLEENNESKAYSFLQLAKLYLQNNESKQAWNTILDCLEKIGQMSQGTLGALGKFAFDIIIEVNYPADWLNEVFEFAISNRPYLLSYFYLENSLKASQIMKNQKLEKEFLDLLRQEKERLKNIIS